MSDLSNLTKLVLTGPEKIETTSRRVRAQYNGETIADATNARHVWENKWKPSFYFPTESLKPGVLSKGKSLEESGSAFAGTIKVGDRSTDKAVVFEKGDLKGLVKIQFDEMDAWYEEDEQIFHGPKDPYKRIDILRSSRPVEVVIDGQTIARSTNSMFLFETLLKTRYYLPKTSILDWKLLTESKTVTACPYKGEANYYNVTVNGKEYKDVIWWYKNPVQESLSIAGMICFYNEKVDIYIDGKKE